METQKPNHQMMVDLTLSSSVQSVQEKNFTSENMKRSDKKKNHEKVNTHKSIIGSSIHNKNQDLAIQGHESDQMLLYIGPRGM